MQAALLRLRGNNHRLRTLSQYSVVCFQGFDLCLVRFAVCL
jgi:hypothetical protein